MNKAKLHQKTAVRILFALATTPVICYFIYQHNQALVTTLKSVQLKYLLVIALFQVAFMGLQGLPFNWLTKTKGADMHTQHWLGLALICSMLNQILPYRPGIGFRIYFLYKYYQLTMKDILHLNMLYFAQSFVISTIMLVLFLPLLDIHLPFKKPLLLLLLVGSAGFICAIIISQCVKQRYLSPKQGVPAKWLQFIVSSMLNEPLVLLKTFFALFFVRCLAVFGHLYAFYAMGLHASFALAAIVVSLITLSSIILITPGNVGISETIVGLITQQLYGDFAIGFSSIALYRACNIATAVLAGMPLSYSLFGSLIPKTTHSG